MLVNVAAQKLANFVASVAFAALMAGSLNSWFNPVVVGVLSYLVYVNVMSHVSRMR